MADYNINAVTRRVVFTGSAGLGPYAFTFEVLNSDDVAVYFNTTLLTITTDYTVTINANGTGSVTIVTGGSVPSTPTASDSIIIVGARDIERVTDFVTAGDLLASSLNEQLDALTIFDQQLAEENARTLRAPVYDPALVEDGGTLDMTLPAKAARAGKYLQFNSTTGNPEAGPDSTDVTTLADIATDIATLADIEDGTDATDAIQTVAGISSNVTTVAGIAANVSTVAGIQADVTAVAGDATDIGTVATNIASVNTVAGNISEVVAVANDLNEAVSEVETVANDLNEAVSEIETVAASISNVDAVGTNIANVNTVAGIDSNVTTVAGISGDVTTVSGISGNVTTVAGISANVTTVAGISSNVTTVAGINSDVTAVAADATDIGTVSTNIANVNTVAGSIANVNTVATNIVDVNSFANQYRIAATAPATSLDEGDLYFDTTQDQMFVYTGSAWVAVSPDIVADTTPQLGGDLDLNGNDITGTGNIDVTGTVTLDAAGNVTDGSGRPTVVLNNTSSGGWSTGTEYGSLEFHTDDTTSGAGLRAKISAKTGGTNGSRGVLGFTTRDSSGTTVETMTMDDTGVDVTGTVTADGLTFDSGDVVTFSANGTATLTSPQSMVFICDNDSNASRVIEMQHGSGTKIAQFADSGDISFYDSTGTTQGLFWDASTQRLGLGTTSVNASLDVRSAALGTALQLSDDTNYGVNFIGVSGGLRMKMNGAQTLTIDQNSNPDVFHINGSGNVGIGTSSPTIASSGGGVHIQDGTQAALRLDHYLNGGFEVQSSSGNLMFYSTAASAERMRIHSGTGRLLVGTTNASPHNISSGTVGGCSFGEDNGGEIASDAYNVFQVNKLSSTSGSLIAFRYNATQTGYISTNGTTTSYNTSSDHRLKENVADMTGAIDRVKALAPKRFNFIADADTTVDGFLAHEAQAVVPEAVTGTHNEVDEDGNAVMQGIDQSKLVPLLTGALQEAIAKIETLEARLTALEGA